MDNYIDVIQKNWQDMWNSACFYVEIFRIINCYMLPTLNFSSN